MFLGRAFFSFRQRAITVELVWIQFLVASVTPPETNPEGAKLITCIFIIPNLTMYAFVSLPRYMYIMQAIRIRPEIHYSRAFHL